MQGKLQSVIVELPHKISGKGYPLHDNYNTRYELKTIPHAVCSHSRSEPSQPKKQHDPFIHLLLAETLGWPC